MLNSVLIFIKYFMLLLLLKDIAMTYAPTLPIIYLYNVSLLILMCPMNPNQMLEDLSLLRISGKLVTYL